MSASAIPSTRPAVTPATAATAPAEHHETGPTGQPPRDVVEKSVFDEEIGKLRREIGSLRARVNETPKPPTTPKDLGWKSWANMAIGATLGMIPGVGAVTNLVQCIRCGTDNAPSSSHKSLAAAITGGAANIAWVIAACPFQNEGYYGTQGIWGVALLGSAALATGLSLALGTKDGPSFFECKS